MHEFDLIRRYFNWDVGTSTSSQSQEIQTSRVHAGFNLITGIGDDAAVLDIGAPWQIVTSIDTLVSGVHFPESTPAHAIGHKSLAVNLSDLAAMGAKPAWFTLALTLPETDTAWLDGFSNGLRTLARRSGIELVGGDTTRGPLTITVQVSGLIEPGKAILRSGAKPGDKLYLTGATGEAAAALLSIKHSTEKPVALSKKAQTICRKRLDYPQPRLGESDIIRRFASACIDVSDGLLQDLTHLLDASGTGVILDIAALPATSALRELDTETARQCQLAGGDDYELLFTIPAESENAFLEAYQAASKKVQGSNGELVRLNCIGSMIDSRGEIRDTKGRQIRFLPGYNHFANQEQS